MARCAFVWGSNANSAFGELRYAKADADRVADVLVDPRYGFDVRRPTDSDPYEIRRALDHAALHCTEKDVFVCYFSGHGLLSGGELSLVLDESRVDNPTTLFPAAWLLETFKHSRAGNRLLILDCCHAGAATGAKAGGAIAASELIPEMRNELILYASGRLEQAREFAQLEGSFLAHGLCDFLVAQHEAPVTLKGLTDYLQYESKTHNEKQRSASDRVPIPFLVGRQQGDFLLEAPDKVAATETSVRATSPTAHYLARTVPEWQRDLLSSDLRERREAAWALGQMGEKARSAVQALLVCLRNDQRKDEYLEALLRIAPGDPRVVLTAIAVLDTEDDRSLGLAARLLAGHPDVAREPLLRSIEDATRRRGALRAIAMIGSPVLEGLLDIASQPDAKPWAGQVHACVAEIAAHAESQLLRIGRDRPELAQAVLRSIAAGDQVSLPARDFAIWVHSTHSKPKLRSLAARVALRNIDDVPFDPATAATGVLDSDASVAQRAADVLKTAGIEGIEAIRSVLSREGKQNDVERWIDLVMPAMVVLGEHLVTLADEIHRAHASLPEVSTKENLRFLSLSYLPQPSLEVLRETLWREHEDQKENAIRRLSKMGTAGLAVILENLESMRGKPLIVAEQVLRAERGSAQDVVAVLGSPTKAILAFCSIESAYCVAIVPVVLASLEQDKFRMLLEQEWMDRARTVLSRAPEVVREAVLSGVLTRDEKHLEFLAQVVNLLPEGDALLASVVPLLGNPETAERAASFVGRFRSQWRYSFGTDGALFADALRGQTQGPGGASAKALLKAFEFDIPGTIRRRIRRVGSVASAVVAIFGAIVALPILPIGVFYALKVVRWRLSLGLLVGGGLGALAANSLKLPLWMSTTGGLTVALVSQFAGVSARIGLGFLRGDEPDTRDAAIAGVCAAAAVVLGILLLAGTRLKIIVPSTAGWVVLGLGAALVGGVHAAIEWVR